MVPCSDETPPPFDQKVDDYIKWKRCFRLWQNVTEVSVNKQASLLILHLDNETQADIFEAVSYEDISSSEGVIKVLAQMDKLFKNDEAITRYETYKAFETYKRPKHTSIKDYCKEFQRNLNKINDLGCQLADDVIAYKLIKSANLSDSQEQLLIATCKITYEELVTQMKKIFTDIQSSSLEVRIKEEQTDLLQDTLGGKYKGFNNSSLWNNNKNELKAKTAQQGKSQNYMTEQNFHKSRSGGTVKKPFNKKRNNPLDQFGRVTKCINCDSFNHWVKDCPEMSEDKHRVLLNYQPDFREEEISNEPTFTRLEIPHYNQEDVFKIDLHLDAIDHAWKNDNSSMVFSEISKSVCGMEWFLEYLETLTSDEKLLVKHEEGNCSFQFSHTELLIPSVQQVMLPQIRIGNKNYNSLEVAVVMENIPLLLAESEVKSLQEINKIFGHDRTSSEKNHTSCLFSNLNAQTGIALTQRKNKLNFQYKTKPSSKKETESKLKVQHAAKVNIPHMKIQKQGKEIKIQCIKRARTMINPSFRKKNKSSNGVKPKVLISLLRKEKQWKKGRMKIKKSIKFICRRKKKSWSKVMSIKEPINVKIYKTLSKANKKCKIRIRFKRKENGRIFSGKRSRWKS